MHNMTNCSTLITMLLFLSSVFAEPCNELRLVQVQGYGEVNVKPDLIDLSFAIQSEGANIMALKETIDTRSKQIFQMLKNSDVASESIAAEQIQIHPIQDYNHKSSTTSGPKNYRIFRSFTVTLDDLEVYPDVLQSLFKLNIDQYQGSTPRSSQVEVLRKAALEKAIANAKEKALFIAAQHDDLLGKLHSYSENSIATPHFAQRSMMAFDQAGMNTEHEAQLGLLKITQSIHVVFRLEDKVSKN